MFSRKPLSNRDYSAQIQFVDILKHKDRQKQKLFMAWNQRFRISFALPIQVFHAAIFFSVDIPLYMQRYDQEMTVPRES